MKNRFEKAASQFEHGVSQAISTLSAKNHTAEQDNLVRTQQDSASAISASAMDIVQPFTEQEIDLSTLPSGGNNYNISGHALVYRRQGSTPGGKLLLDCAGSIRDFSPGDRLNGPFLKFAVRPSTRCVAAGLAHIVIERMPDFSYLEKSIVQGIQFDPVTLLGTISPVGAVSAFVSNTLATKPTAVDGTQVGAFRIDGFSKIRILVDTDPDASGTFFSSVTLEPWFLQGIGGIWTAQTVASITVPDASTTTRYKILTMDIAGGGYMFLNPVGNAGGGSTHCAFAVQGIA